MMTDRVTVGNLRVARVLYDFITNEALPGTDIDPDTFWSGVDKVVADLTPKNEELLAKRDDLQARIDKWHRQRVIEPIDQEAYKAFLIEIGYLQPEPEDFTITTSGVDDEITTTAGPQLVVPILNARFALNAANARWGSLYDALYGTDVIPETDGAEKGSSYNRVRGDKVIAYARDFLDTAAPLAAGSWSDAVGLRIDDGQLLIDLGDSNSVGSSSSATPASSAIRRGRCCCATTACTSRSSSTRPRPSAPPTRPASRTSCWSPRSPRSWTSRTRWPRSTPTTRCSATATGWA
jgi:malate synthase